MSSGKTHKKSKSWHGNVATQLSTLLGAVLTTTKPSRSQEDVRDDLAEETEAELGRLGDSDVPGPAPGPDHRPASEEAEEEVPDELKCQVCLELVVEPQRLHPCAHSFCGPCLRLLAASQLSAPCNTCPLCRSPVFWASANAALEAAAARLGRASEERRAWLKLHPQLSGRESKLPLPGASLRLLGLTAGPGPALRALFVSILCLGLFFILFLPCVYVSSHVLEIFVVNLTDLEFGATVAALGRNEWLSLSQSLFPVCSLLAVLFLSSYLVFAA